MPAPSKGDDAKRRIITMRVTNAAYDRIAAAAEANGRSVSQEIESRLELSFQEEQIIGGKDANLLTKLIAGVVGLIELETERSWTQDRMTWEAVNAAVSRVVSWFQPEMDFDIWDKYRDKVLLPFVEAVWSLNERAERLRGLEEAYPPVLMPMPEGIRAEYDKAKEEFPRALRAVRERAKAVFDGPMKEQAARNKEAVELGRQIAGERQGKKHRNWVVGGVMRMYARSGAFEPLPGMRNPADIEDSELFECVRKLAGEPPEDPDMSIFRMSRTYEDIRKLSAEAKRAAGEDNGDDQEA